MKKNFLDLCWRVTEGIASPATAIIIWLGFEIYYGYAVLTGEGNAPVPDSAPIHPPTNLTLFIIWTAGGVFLLLLGLWSLRKRKK